MLSDKYSILYKQKIHYILGLVFALLHPAFDYMTKIKTLKN